MRKAQSCLKVCWRFTFLLGFLMTLALVHFSSSLAGSRSSVPTFAQAQPTRPFNMVTLGDSIMWGQGLPESLKFRNIVANWLQSQYGNSRNFVQWTTHAHSGAVTGFGAYPAETQGNDPDTWYQTNVSSGYQAGYPYPGEIPFSYPSISAQIGLTATEQNLNSSMVDLVLLDGGINDTNVFNILNFTDITTDAGWVARITQTGCVGHMQSLLPQVLNQFPNAVVIITGYFPIVSSKSDFNLVGALLGIHGIPLPPEWQLGKDALVARSTAFNDTARSGLSALVTQTNAGLASPRVGLAWPAFAPDNSYAAPNTYLFKVGEFADDEARGMNFAPPPGDWNTTPGIAYYRAESCSRLHPDPKCYDASMGHPNPAGAQAYATAIINALAGTFAAKLGLPQPKPLFTRFNSGTDANGPYVSISNGPYAPRYWTQVPTWIRVSAVNDSNSPVQGTVTMEPIPPRNWDGTQLLEGASFGVLPSEYLPTQLQQTGQKFYYMCLPGGDSIWLPSGYPYPIGAISGSTGRPSNLTPFPGNQQGCWLQVSAPGYITCVLQLGPAPSSSNPLGGLFGGSATPKLPGPPCPAAAPTIGGTVASVQNNTIAGGLHAGTTAQLQQLQLPALAVKVSSTVASGLVTDTITVTSGAAPVAGVTVTSGTTAGNSSFVTNTKGVVVITHGECFSGPVAKVGETTAPKRTPVPCKFTETASKPGYQTLSFIMP